MKFQAVTVSQKGTINIASAPLGKGGEGSVYEIVEMDLAGFNKENMVAKIYHDPTVARKNKLKAMIVSPPQSDALAWPKAVLIGVDGFFKGYLMEKVDPKEYKAWAVLAHAKERREVAPSFDVKYGIMACRNLAAAISSVNSAGHCLGDINESNIFISGDSSVLIVDTDSAQISSAQIGNSDQNVGGQVFPCEVGKPEFTAPELIGKSFRDSVRTPQTDVFAFGIAVYQMLTGGAHPTDGILKNDGEPMAVASRIKNDVYPGLKPNADYEHPKRIPNFAIPETLRKMILACVSYNPDSRPSIESLIPVFDNVVSSLKQCSRDKHHWFDGNSCGWCAHVGAHQPDPWAPVASVKQKNVVANGGVSKVQQTGLPKISFSESKKNSLPQRSGPQRAGSSVQQGGSYGNHPSLQQNMGVGGPQNSVRKNFSANIGMSSTQQNFPPNSGQPPVQKKGSKTLLKYADGSVRPRPPLLQLAKSNPKMAWECFIDELPDFMKFWWVNNKSPIPNIFSLTIGLFLALLLSVAWVWLIPNIMTPIAPEWSSVIWSYGGFFSGVSSMIVVLFYSFLGIVYARRNNSTTFLEKDSFINVLFKSVGLSVIYGPFLFAVIIGGTVLAIGNLLLNLLRDGSRR